jgi:pimeloyl-ACP methyl ester carboxylesterase
MPSLPDNSAQHLFAYDNNVQIHYEVHGQGSPAIVFLHGFGASRESWRDILPYLRNSGTIYIVDLKGHGLSSKPNDSRYSLKDQADIISAFLMREHIEPAVLVGHSYGGAVALMTYFHSRANVQALVLIDSAAYPQSFPFFVSVLQKPILNHVILSVIPAATRARYTLERLFYDRSKVDDERVERYARYFDLPGAHHAFIECANLLLPPDIDSFVAQIPTVSIPALILWGGEDTVVPLSIGRRLHHEVPSSQFIVIPNCGHIPQEEQPEVTADAIKAFLISLRRRQQ